MAFLPGDPRGRGGPIPGNLIVTFKEGTSIYEAQRVIEQQGCDWRDSSNEIFENMQIAFCNCPVGREAEYITTLNAEELVLQAEQEQMAELM